MALGCEPRECRFESGQPPQASVAERQLCLTVKSGSSGYGGSSPSGRTSSQSGQQPSPKIASSRASRPSSVHSGSSSGLIPYAPGGAWNVKRSYLKWIECSPPKAEGGSSSLPERTMGRILPVRDAVCKTAGAGFNSLASLHGLVVQPHRTAGAMCAGSDPAGATSGARAGPKDSYTWRLRGGTAADLMRSLSPQLGARRNLQINQALASWQPACHRRWLASEIAEMMALKSAGQPRSAIAARYGVQPKRVSDLLSSIARGHHGQKAPSVAAAAIKASRRIGNASTGDTDTSWLAGLLEGEGYFGCVRPHTVRIALTMIDRDVVERAALMLGAKVYPIQARQENWMPSWGVTVYGQCAPDIAGKLEPLLGRRRREQIRRMRQHHRPPRRFVAPPDRVARNIEIARTHFNGESGPDLASAFGMTHQNVYYIARRYRDQVS
jgi:hypothetical protein